MDLETIALRVYHSFHDHHPRSRATHDALMPEALVPALQMTVDSLGRQLLPSDVATFTRHAHDYARELTTNPRAEGLSSRLVASFGLDEFRAELCSERFHGLGWERGTLAPAKDAFEPRMSFHLGDAPHDAVERPLETRAPVVNPIELLRRATEAGRIVPQGESSACPAGAERIGAREAASIGHIHPVQFQPF